MSYGTAGNETRNNAPNNGGGTPPTPPQPPVEPQPCAGIAAPRFAEIRPNCVKYGQEFYLRFHSFEPNEQIGFWITDESGLTLGTVQTVAVDANGEIDGYIDTTDFLPPGNYVFVAQDANQEREPSIAPFRVIP